MTRNKRFHLTYWPTWVSVLVGAISVVGLIPLYIGFPVLLIGVSFSLGLGTWLLWKEIGRQENEKQATD